MYLPCRCIKHLLIFTEGSVSFDAMGRKLITGVGRIAANEKPLKPVGTHTYETLTFFFIEGFIKIINH